MFQQVGRKRCVRKVARVLRAHAKRRGARHDMGFPVQQIDSPLISSEEFHNLAKCAIQHFIQFKRLIERLADRVQHQKFAVPAANFLLRLFALRDVEHKSLIGRDSARTHPV